MLQSWYVAQLKPAGLAAARRNLDRQQIPSFMPLIPVQRKTPRGMVWRDAPLFPGYVFTQVLQDIHFGKINSTLGVSRLILASRERPQPMPVAFMQALFARCDAEGRMTAKAPFAPGDKVELTGDLFTGLLAEVVEMSGPDRVRVLLEVMGRAVRVEIGLQSLERHIPSRPALQTGQNSHFAR